MSHKCSECNSAFREKKNLNQHLRKAHGILKYKCDHCNFRVNDQSNLRKHERAKHAGIVFACHQCEYTTEDRSNLNRHIRSKHIEKDIKCAQCNFVTDRNDKMESHVKARHTLKTCNECDFSTLSQKEMKNHKKTQHEPDDFYVESAFNNMFYNKTWHVRGHKDPTMTLLAYKAKIRNTIQHYVNTKGPMKWYLGMKVIMIKYAVNGEIAEADPGFTSRPQITTTLWNFDTLYTEAGTKIVTDFLEFNANGSGWILERVENISIKIAGYQPHRGTAYDDEEERAQERWLDSVDF